MANKPDPTPAEIYEACARIRANRTDRACARQLTVGREGIREIPVPRELAGCVEAYNAG